MQVRAKFGVGVGIIVIALSALAWMGARESQTYYHTVAELSSSGRHGAAAAHPRRRRRGSRLHPAPGGTHRLRNQGRGPDPSGQLRWARPAAGHFQGRGAVPGGRPRHAGRALRRRTGAGQVRIEVRSGSRTRQHIFAAARNRRYRSQLADRAVVTARSELRSDEGSSVDLFGSYSLLLAFLCALYAIGGGIAAIWTRRPLLIKSARNAGFAVCVLDLAVHLQPGLSVRHR